MKKTNSKGFKWGVCKAVSAFAAAVLLIAVCSGCASKENVNSTAETQPASFSDEKSMKSQLEGYYWVNNAEESDSEGYIHYRICVFEGAYCYLYDLTRSSRYTLADMLKDMYDELEYNRKPTFSTVAALLEANPSVEGYERNVYKVVYVPDERLVKSDDGSVVWEILPKSDGGYPVWSIKSNTVEGDSQIVYERTKELSELNSAYSTVIKTNEEAKKDAFMSKYSGLPTYIDAKYDPYSFFGSARDFIITGRAELSDYYNYEYRDLESMYFCVCVTPTGGGFSDRWYIYCYRNQYKSLFEQLKKGSISNITMICYAAYYEAISKEMANLSDYYIG